MKSNNQNIGDYDLSIIMPFYKRAKIFEPVFREKYQFFQRNGIELILCLDEPSEEKEIMDIVRSYPLINWKIIINENDHEWRNPAKAINVGIRHASKKYILQMDPELEFLTDVIHILRLYMDYYPDHYAIGRVIFSSLEQKITLDNFDKLNLEILPFGSIIARKSHFEAAFGYNENYNIWGGEDDNIRTRFDLMGLQRLYYPEAILIHREDFSKRITTRGEQRQKIDPDLLADMLIPNKVISNDINWGCDFDKVIYDWQTPSLEKKNACLNYLKGFKKYDLLSDAVFDKNYQLIVLIPVYNCSGFLKKCIDSILPFCDGIIVLDDDSTDDSYELANSEKTLMRVSKERMFFDDLGNRNILLDLVSFFCADWCLFLDSDEWMSNKWNDLNIVMKNTEIDIVSFWILNLWDSEDYYRADMYDESFAQYGFWVRWRMFRNKGRMQIYSPEGRKLHFASTPYFSNYHVSNTVLLHAGYLTKEYRSNKFLFYGKEDDKNPQKYEDIVVKEVELKPLNGIDENYILNQNELVNSKLETFFLHKSKKRDLF